MLSNQTFYWGTTRKAIIAFGNLFNSIYLERKDQSGVQQQTLKVPITYAPKEKYLARAMQEPDIDNPAFLITLPRMAFEITGIQYDASRKMNSNIKVKSIVDGIVKTQYTPVPYNINISLYVLTKTQDDALQIMEQILPTFNPAYTLSVNMIPEMNLTHDLPIILDSVSHEDNFDEAFENRREIVYTFNFTLQLNYYGAIDGTQRGLIRRTDVGVFSDHAYLNQEGNISEEISPFMAKPTDPYVVVEHFDGFV